MKIIRVITALFIVTGCDNEDGKMDSSFSGDTTIVNILNVEDTLSHEKLNLSENTIINIITAEKQFKYDSTAQKDFNYRCNKWGLTKSDIERIFRFSQTISGLIWDLDYVIMPCSYTGKIEIDGKVGSYDLNAGASIVLIFSDTAYYLGCTSKEIRSLFLEYPVFGGE